RTREHDLRERRVLAHERAEGVEAREQIGARVARLRERREAPAQRAEALEEQLAYEARLVAEQLVDGGRRGVRLLRDLAGREAGHAVAGQDRARDLQHAVAQLEGALLRSGHGGARASCAASCSPSASMAARIARSADSRTRSLVAVWALRSSRARSLATRR